MPKFKFIPQTLEFNRIAHRRAVKEFVEQSNLSDTAHQASGLLHLTVNIPTLKQYEHYIKTQKASTNSAKKQAMYTKYAFLLNKLISEIKTQAPRVIKYYETCEREGRGNKELTKHTLRVLHETLRAAENIEFSLNKNEDKKRAAQIEELIQAQHAHDFNKAREIRTKLGDLSKREQLILGIRIAEWQGRKKEAKALQEQMNKLDRLEK